MTSTPTPPPTRERTLALISLRMALTGGALAAVAAIALAFGVQQDDPLHDLSKGLGTGMLTALPLFFAGRMLAMYRHMDEFARLQLTQAASLAFLVTMIVSGGAMALQALLHFPTPAWAFYVLGMGSWLATSVLQTVRLGGRERP